MAGKVAARSVAAGGVAEGSETAESVLAELQRRGNEKTRVLYGRHGIPIERTFGVSNADLKVLAKGLKGRQELALALYGTGQVDAMYLAGIIADGGLMTKAQVSGWARGADGIPMIAQYTVPWVTVEHEAGAELAEGWIDSGTEKLMPAGWASYAGLATVRPDAELDVRAMVALLGKVLAEMGTAEDRTRQTMNHFVIAVGAYVVPLRKQAMETARALGTVTIDPGETACKVPSAVEAIRKIEARGGGKRKTIRC